VRESDPGILRNCWQATLVIDLKGFANPVATRFLPPANTVVVRVSIGSGQRTNSTRGLVRAKPLRAGHVERPCAAGKGWQIVLLATRDPNFSIADPSTQYVATKAEFAYFLTSMVEMGELNEEDRPL
jgi:hypothetical protein